MPSSSASKTSRVAQFISRRIDELRHRRSQLEIATAAGFNSPNMLSMIKDGKSKMPMDRVISLARALECDPAELARLSLEQFYEPAVLDTIFAAAPRDETSRELAAVAAWGAALGVELRSTIREVKHARQFATSLLSRTERVDGKLERIKLELDQLIDAARTPGALLKVK